MGNTTELHTNMFTVLLCIMYRSMQLQIQILVTILIHNTLFYLNGKLAPPLKQLSFLSDVTSWISYTFRPFPQNTWFHPSLNSHFKSQSDQFLCIKSSLTQHFFAVNIFAVELHTCWHHPQDLCSEDMIDIVYYEPAIQNLPWRNIPSVSLLLSFSWHPSHQSLGIGAWCELSQLRYKYKRNVTNGGFN